MRGLLILVFVAKATAAGLGYDYQQLRQNAATGSTAGGSSAGFEQLNTNANTLGVTNAFGSGPGGFDSGLGNNINNFNDINGFSSLTTVRGGNPNDAIGLANSNNAASPQPVATEFSKEFYSYKAPPEDETFSDADIDAAAGLVRRKNLRVIFIKAPENQALTKAALQLAKQAASEDRTAIYVFTKQTDAAELANRLQTIKSNHNANKPEVHFVKYRTPEDAARAQQAIQAQYDALGGQTFSSNAAVAPVLNFVGGSGGGGAEGSQSAAAYLPPALLRA